MENKAYADKTSWYYNLFKPGLAALIPEGPNTILDLGCATGTLGRGLKELNKAREMVGIEIFEEAATEAEKYYEKVFCGDVERVSLDYDNYFDFVICGDILEHLVDPWKILRRIRGWLKSEGSVIISTANVRYWRVLRSLIFQGNWEYTEAGILDNTHLRFFTTKSLLKNLLEAGFDVEVMKVDVKGVKQRFANAITFRVFEEFLGSQIVTTGKKPLPLAENQDASRVRRIEPPLQMT
jgi:2-polyprenyl-3-methyl-5-hydroxy-6-metoxy-1,4-benzoquinol methylase